MDQITTDQADHGSVLTTDYAHIMRQSGVRSGNPIVAGTRIGVHDVISLLQTGETVDSIVTRCFSRPDTGPSVRMSRLLRGSPRGN
jgi:Protein of unknown function (DUF433)